ncbi:hypothetical protein AVEN_42403-1, partial [Araneus ventricosus]
VAMSANMSSQTNVRPSPPHYKYGNRRVRRQRGLDYGVPLCEKKSLRTSTSELIKGEINLEFDITEKEFGIKGENKGRGHAL